MRDLALGTYRFVEVSAPEGYELETQPVEFTLAEDTPGLAATVTASRRFRGPSAEIAVEGRIAATTTTGLSLLSTRLRKKAVSSSVSVPWVITTPSTFPCFSSAETRLPRVTSLSSVKSSELILKTCSPVTEATSVICGTAAIRASMPTLPAS